MTIGYEVPVIVRLPSHKLDDRDFDELCRLNPEKKVEQTSDGEIIIMPPTGGEAGRINFNLTGEFSKWAKQDDSGIAFDSSTLFVLPNAAKRSPDLAWIKRERWETLSKKQREGFPPLCPDFVVEIRSPSDSLKTLQAKMQEYIANGAQLGWLLDPIEKRVYIYCLGQAVQQLNNPAEVSGDPLLRGFVLDIQKLLESK
ncbi:MAG: Uma2 family endonuclease [Chloroflexi bacterium]|nr:Uma2 family endonuclease [Chloroflexota bacterium]MBI3741726.1 Uma2 family endonuclease [Chloroflexota bacterium]